MSVTRTRNVYTTGIRVYPRHTLLSLDDDDDDDAYSVKRITVGKAGTVTTIECGAACDGGDTLTVPPHHSGTVTFSITDSGDEIPTDLSIILPTANAIVAGRVTPYEFVDGVMTYVTQGTIKMPGADGVVSFRLYMTTGSGTSASGQRRRRQLDLFTRAREDNAPVSMQLTLRYGTPRVPANFPHWSELSSSIVAFIGPSTTVYNY